jgi:cytochrome c553
MKRVSLVLTVAAAAACSAAPTKEPGHDWSALPPVVAPDAELARIGTRDAQYEKFCAARHGDTFFARMCGASRPNLGGLDDLLRLVGLDEHRAFALTGNSTSLVAMSVSAVNPRVLLFPRVEGDLERPGELTAIGFARGEPFVEVVSRDRATGELRFYLVAFERACDYDKGCDLASLVTEEIEHGWTAYSVYGEEDLAKTSFDCAACHEPGGHGTRKILRMQELTSPWLHWFPQKFVRRTDSDRMLSAQFLEAHDVDERYGGVPVAAIAGSIDDGSAAQLEALVRAEGDGDQPNPFDSRIEAEAAGGGTSAAWLAAFDASLRGEAITVPYPRADVTDPSKRDAAVQSYRRVVTRAAPRETLLDPRDLFSQDALEKLSFVPRPGADGRAVLLQMCSRCHDGRADPKVSRYKFDVQKLDEMSRVEKDLAILRMHDPPATRMPPWRVGRMTPEAIEAATAELAK